MYHSDQQPPVCSTPFPDAVQTQHLFIPLCPVTDVPPTDMRIVQDNICDIPVIRASDTRSESVLSFVEEVRAAPASRRSPSVESDIPSAQPQSFSFPPVLSPRGATSPPLEDPAPTSVATPTVPTAMSASMDAPVPAGHRIQSDDDRFDALVAQLLALINKLLPQNTVRPRPEAATVTPLPEPTLDVAPVSAAPSVLPTQSSATTPLAMSGHVAVPAYSLVSPMVPPPLGPLPS